MVANLHNGILQLLGPHLSEVYLKFLRAMQLMYMYSKNNIFFFLLGENIELECNLNNFPTMKKSKAIKISFIRYVHKTNSAK